MRTLDHDSVERILTSFLVHEAKTAGFSKAVLGLSGGIDSAVVCFLAARAYGPENVLAINMPTSTSNPESQAHAELVAKATEVPYRVVDISKMAEGYLPTMQDPTPLRKGNVFARCRMIVLYDVSAEWNGLVLGTSNKTELLLGYGTLFGDLASAINPIGDLYKTQLRALAEHLGVPEPVRTKPPSADLWEGQNDEEELGATYEQLDTVLEGLVEDRHSVERLVADGHDEDFVRSIVRRVRMNQYKRRPPLIAKISGRTIGPDFRLPRDAVASPLPRRQS